MPKPTELPPPQRHVKQASMTKTATLFDHDAHREESGSSMPTDEAILFGSVRKRKRGLWAPLLELDAPLYKSGRYSFIS
jgi:hypothetical protein